MKTLKNKKMVAKHFWRGSLLVPAFILFALAFFMLRNQASALTPVEVCNTGAAGRAECLKALDVKIWNACISQPEDQRGACGEAIRRGEAFNGVAPITSTGDEAAQQGAFDTKAKGDVCGGGTTPSGYQNNEVKTVINIGCRGKGNPIVDLTFAIIRILSIGVGIVVVASVVVGGIQYTTAGGDPQKAAAAIKRITSSVGALVLYIFIYAILNWIIPAGVFK